VHLLKSCSGVVVCVLYAESGNQVDLVHVVPDELFWFTSSEGGFIAWYTDTNLYESEPIRMSKFVLNSMSKSFRDIDLYPQLLISTTCPI